MIQFSEEISINVVPERIFSLYADVASWKHWDPEVTSSSITGVFTSGVTGKLKPTKGLETKFRITSVQKNKSFTAEFGLPLCTATFEHELFPSGNTTRVIHRVAFKGFLAFFFGRVVGSQIRKGLPVTMQGLKRAAESTNAT